VDVSGKFTLKNSFLYTRHNLYVYVHEVMIG